MEENFGIASFRSRQQVMRLDTALKRAGVPSSIITTPRAVALGCGLSVRFDLSDAQDVLAVYQQAQPGNLIGFYRVHREESGRTSVVPLGLERGEVRPRRE